MKLVQSTKLLFARMTLVFAGGLAMPLTASAAAASPPPPHHVNKVHVKPRVIYPIHVRGHVVVPVNLTHACAKELGEVLGEEAVTQLIPIFFIVGPYAIPVEAVLIPYDVYRLTHECHLIGSPPPPFSTLPVTRIPVTGPYPCRYPATARQRLRLPHRPNARIRPDASASLHIG